MFRPGNFFVLLVICFLTNENAFSQKLTDLFKELEAHYSVRFSYDSDLAEGVPSSVSLKKVSLESDLALLTEKTAFTFEIINSTSVLVKPDQQGMNYKICAEITDRLTGEKLPGVNAFNPGKNILLGSDANGRIEQYLVYRNDSVYFTFIGYKPKIISLNSFSSGNCLEIYLEQDEIQLSEVTVTAYLAGGIKYNTRDNSIVIRPSDLGGLPGETGGDVFTSLEILPGITTPDSKAGNLNIRGSSPDQTLILYDNIPIYHKGYYFGTISPYNPKVVEEISVYRSSFPSERGGRVGGVIDIRTSEKASDSLTGSITLSTTDAAFVLHLPVIKGRSGIVLGGRSSIPFWTAPKIDSISDFVFQESYVQRVLNNLGAKMLDFSYQFDDINLKFIQKVGTKHNLSAGLLQIRNKMLMHSEDQVAKTNSRDTISMNNQGISLRFNSRWNSKIKTDLKTTWSDYRQSFSNYYTEYPNIPRGGSEYTNHAEDFTFYLSGEFQCRKKDVIQLGLDFHSHNLLFRKYYSAPGFAEEIAEENTGLLYTVFTSYNWNTHRVTANAGVRLNYFTLSGQSNTEPRFSFNYKIRDELIFKSAAGLYRQYVTQIPGLNIETIGGLDNLVWILADEESIPVMKSVQIMSGIIYSRPDLTIDFEYYYKNVHDISIFNYRTSGNSNKYFYGSVLSYGGDLLIRKSFGKLNTWLCYTLSRSMMDIDSILPEPFYSIYDQTHVLDLGASLSWKKFKFSAGWKYRTGLASLPGIRTALLSGFPSNGSSPSIGNPVTFLPGSVEEYRDRFPAFHQLDISGMYLFRPRSDRWNGSVGFSITNLYNQKNIIEQLVRQSPKGALLVNRYSLGFAPNVALTINW